MAMMAALVLGLAKTLVDKVPEPPLLRFCMINIMGFFLFVVSIVTGRRVTDPKHQWYNNAFSVSGIILIVFSSMVEVDGDIHSGFLPAFYAIELAGIILLAKRLRLQPESWTELTEMN
jgi:hypothetical protein